MERWLGGALEGNMLAVDILEQRRRMRRVFFTPMLLFVIVIICYDWEVGCRVGVSVTDCIHFSQLLFSTPV